MPSHNLSTINIDGLELLGYSVAGEETVIGVPQLNVCFDIGKAPDQLISISNLLLTHGHMDHAAGIAYYLSHRKFCGQKPGVVLTPENTIEPIKQILMAWGTLDGNHIPAELVGMRPGDEYKIKPNLLARAFATKHNRGSLGYTIIETKNKLKPEYCGLRGPEIVKLKKQNVTIDYPVEDPIVTYLGDTKKGGFIELDFVAKSKILIAECTFVVDEHIGRAEAGNHMHVDEFVEMIDGFENQHIIITHLSQRTFIGQAKKVLKEKLSKEQYEKTILLMDRRK
ncbi:MAG: hypothetical protein K8R02_09700 [Anaerohalosphaeraceae bacterium]|nr:hypothetical protein [Anaerohalosphaeraceae bacterium]